METSEGVYTKIPPIKTSSVGDMAATTPSPLPPPEQPRPSARSSTNVVVGRSGAIFFELTKRLSELYSCKDYACSVCEDNIEFLALVCDHGGLEEKITQKLLSLGVVELFQNIWALHFEADFLNEEHPTLSLNMQTLLSVVVNLTDSSSEVCRRVVDVGLHKDLLRYLTSGKFVPEKKTGVVVCVAVVECLMGLLYNVVQAVSEAREMFRDNDAVEVFQTYRNCSLKDLSCMALVLQAYVVNDADNERINSERDSFVYLALELKTCLLNKHHKHRSKQGYKAVELLAAFNKLAVSPANKENILKTSALSSYVEFLQDDCSVEEQLAAVDGIWLLSFTCPDDIKQLNGCVEGLQKLVQSSDERIRRQAKGALGTLGLLDDRPRSVIPGSNRRVIENKTSDGAVGRGEKMVFISYQHGSRDTVFQVRNRLKSSGFSMWIDEDEMCGSIAEDITEGLDRAAVVLVYLSQKYYESPYCRKEIVYADDGRKEIIPLTVEPRFKPDGWLKFRLGDRLRIDFCREEQFEAAFRTLIKQIRQTLASGDAVDGPQQTQKANTCINSSVVTTTGHQPPSDDIQSRTVTIRTWTKSDVANWISSQGLHQFKEWFSNYDGSILLECRALKDSAPEAFTAAILKQFTFEDVLRLNKALRQLL